MKNPRPKLRPNEDTEHIKELHTANPNHTTQDWINEALALNLQHCGDDDRAISNMLYLALESAEKNNLTCSTENATVLLIARALATMEETIKKIVEKYQDIQRQIRVLTRSAESLKDSLRLIGYRPEYVGAILGEGKSQDERYAEELPFKHATLVQACKQVLRDHSPEWLSKTQVEYLVSMGGFEFSTSNRKNSVRITLDRLASNGFCNIDHDLRENRYRWEPKPSKPQTK